jgi:hypothetical protein
MPITRTPASPKIDERDLPTAMLDRDPHLAIDSPELLLVAGKGIGPRRCARRSNASGSWRCRRDLAQPPHRSPDH